MFWHFHISFSALQKWETREEKLLHDKNMLDALINKTVNLFILEVQHLLGTIKTYQILKISVENKVELIFSFYRTSSLLLF